MKNYILALTISLLFSVNSLAQKFEYGLNFIGLGDNREFFSGYSQSETIFGSGLDFDIGAGIDSVHSFRAGISYFYDFGTDFLKTKPSTILYYSHSKNSWGFIIGAFPRCKVIPLPLSFVSEKYSYLNTTIDGMLISYSDNKFKANIFADWVSMIDSVNREQFMTAISGIYIPGKFILEGHWYLFHDRPNFSRPEGEHINDYMGANFMVGYNFNSLIPIDNFTLKTGVLSSLYRNRGNGLTFEVANSAYIDFCAEYKGYGVHSVFNLGEQHHFKLGDEFYNNTSDYIRTDLYFTPIRYKNIEGKFTWSFHVANSKLDHQQIFSLIYIISPI